MKITEMYEKAKNSKGNIKSKNLDAVVAGGSAEDFVRDGDLVTIIDKSEEGFYDSRFGDNAVFVIMDRSEKQADDTIKQLDEAVQINLSAFDRSAVPYKKMADGTVARNGDAVRADGTAVASWKAAKSAKVFMQENKGKTMKFTLKDTVSVRAWDRAAEAWSKTELRDQKVYTIDWV